MVSLIAAMSKNRVIGNNNCLPWHIPEELQHFKNTTMGKPMIMGKTTFESIGRKVLPGRTTIVLSRDSALQPEGFLVARSIDDALQKAGDVPEVMVVGGAKVYEQFLPIAHKIYLTVIPKECDGDAFFPELQATRWKLVANENYDKFEVNIYEGT